MSGSSTQLRVPGGLHAGAVVDLDETQASWQVGFDPNNDVVLLDAPFAQLTLQRLDGAWAWRVESQPEAQPCAAGQGIRLDEYALILADASSQWSLLPPLGWCWEGSTESADMDAARSASGDVGLQAEAPEDDPVLGSDEAGSSSGMSPGRASATGGGEGEIVAGPATQDIPAAQAPGPQQRVAGRFSPWRFGVAAAVVVSAGLGLAWTAGFFDDQATRTAAPRQMTVGAPSSPSLQDAVQAAPADPAVVEAVRVALGRALVANAAQVKVKAAAQGKVEVVGVVTTDEVTEELVRVASKVTPHLKLSLLTQADLAAQLQSVAARAEPGMQVRAGELAEVVLDGTVEHLASVNEVKSIINKEIPQVFHVKSLVMTTRQREEEAARRAEASKPRVPTLPTLAAVVSGTRPYVVLANGQKVQPGGVVGPLRLAEIQPEVVIFEDERGMRFQLRR